MKLKQVDRSLPPLPPELAYMIEPDTQVHVALDAVTEHLDLPPDWICQRTRSNPYRLARHLVWYLCYANQDYTLSKLARLLGLKNHGTVHTAVHRLNGELHYNKRLMLTVSSIALATQVGMNEYREFCMRIRR